MSVQMWFGGGGHGLTSLRAIELVSIRTARVKKKKGY